MSPRTQPLVIIKWSPKPHTTHIRMSVHKLHFPGMDPPTWGENPRKPSSVPDDNYCYPAYTTKLHQKKKKTKTLAPIMPPFLPCVLFHLPSKIKSFLCLCWSFCCPHSIFYRS